MYLEVKIIFFTNYVKFLSPISFSWGLSFRKSILKRRRPTSFKKFIPNKFQVSRLQTMRSSTHSFKCLTPISQP